MPKAPAAPSNHNRVPRVGIALSGGGARGIAHIGVLKALLEQGVEPVVVSGTSSGAIVGSLYAYGLDAEALQAFARVGVGVKLLRIVNPLRGLIKLTLLREKLEAVLPEDDFSCLRRPLAVTATNLQTGDLHIFGSGPLIAAVQASCAVPLLFHPVEIDGQQYIDGGLYMNLPAAPIRERCDVLIGSNVMPHEQAEVGRLSSVFSISNRVFDLAVHHNSLEARGLCDLLVEPIELKGYHVYNFAKADDLVEVGYREMTARMPALRKLLDEWRPSSPDDEDRVARGVMEGVEGS